MKLSSPPTTQVALEQTHTVCITASRERDYCYDLRVKIRYEDGKYVCHTLSNKYNETPSLPPKVTLELVALINERVTAFEANYKFFDSSSAV